MIRTLKTLAFAGALVAFAAPAFAAEVMDTAVGKFDLDPFNVLAPAEAPAPAAPAPAPVKKHHHHKKKM